MISSMVRWMVVIAMLVAVTALFLGCASTASQVAAPPMPEDFGRWSQPQVVQEPVPDELIVPQKKRAPRPTEKVFEWESDREYAVEVAIHKPLRLAFQEGEKIYNVVDGFRGVLPEGDEKPPWEAQEALSGDVKQPHVLVTVTKPGLTNGVTVTTSKRVYDVALKSVERSKVRVVRWEYPPETVAKRKEPAILPDSSQPQQYHIGYRWESSEPRPVWEPRQVLDTGEQTFIVLPRNVAAMQAPMIRLLGNNGPELVNALQYKNVLILSHLFDAAELRYGVDPHAQVVTVYRESGRRISCPGDAECPIWPTTMATALR